MAEFQIRATEVQDVGFAQRVGDVVLALLMEDGDTVHLGLPIDDIPKLSVLLALGYGQSSKALAMGDLQTTIVLEGAEFLDHPNPAAVTLLAKLSSGQPIAFSIGREDAKAFRRQLDELLE